MKAASVKKPLTPRQRQMLAAKGEKRKARDSWAIIKNLAPCEKKTKQ